MLSRNDAFEQRGEFPLISIIVAVYNTAEYLPQCVDSICAQTYRNIEIILVDDGSTDKSGDICDSYAEKDERIRVIHKPNGGQGEARNLGLDVCCGEYIGFVDSDDYIVPHMLERLYRASVEYDATVVCCQSIRLVDDVTHRDSMTETHVYHTKEDMIRALLGRSKRVSPTTAPWNKIYKKEIFAHLRFPVGMMMEDTYIIPDIIDGTQRMVELPDALYYYRARAGSTTLPKHWDSHMGDLLASYIRVHAVIAQKYPATLDVAEKRLIWAYCGSIFRGAGTAEYRSHIHELRAWQKDLRAQIFSSFRNPYNGMRQMINILMAAYLPPRLYSRIRSQLVDKHCL